MNRIIFLLIFLIIVGTVQATTWVPSEMTDPLTGEKVPAWEISSFGTYIYDWPSKYDLIFWPFTDEEWICLNPKNGYVAFNNDFEKVSDEEKKTLTEWLAKNYAPSQVPKSHEEKLVWLEKVYRQRKMNDNFWCTFYRLMAYFYRGDKKKSLEYVNKAIPLLEASLKDNIEDTDKIGVFFLLGEYYRRTGDMDKSKEYFTKVKTSKYKSEDGKEQVGHPYFIRLVLDREQPPKEKSSPKPDGSDGK